VLLCPQLPGNAFTEHNDTIMDGNVIDKIIGLNIGDKGGRGGTASA
jgi:hypothetical protein